jgi:2-polyprenyl-6-methoxyphenol hydroxylase-like FAD-dependent oxidoreductase
VAQVRRGAHAVVCGASMGGLLAARALADAYESVTVVERDVLPEAAVQRRGVSQGRHLHALVRRGSLVLEELLPGLWDELLAAGANVIDGTDPSVIHAEIGDHVLSQSGVISDPESLVTQIASRPLLEALVRRRVRAIPNIAFRENHDVVEPVLGRPDRVTAVRVVDRSTNEKGSLEADIVVDATGRSARMPAFLEKHGYPAPPEQTYAIGLSYSSQFFRVPEGAITEKMLLTAPTLERPLGAGLLAYEHGSVILTLIGIAGHRLPTDLPGVMMLVAELLPERITAALHAAEPLGDVTAQHYPASVWRRYDKLKRFPKGLAVLGDAVCSFNPVYGQGMTSSAIQAKALRRRLTDGTAEDVVGPYFRDVARQLAPIWKFNRLNDFGIIPVQGWRIVPQRVLNWQLDKLMTAASNDIAVAETFLRTLGLVESPTHQFRPSRLLRVIKGNRQRR